MADRSDKTPNPEWHSRTRAVHAGTRRSQFGELSEAIFLTQGFDYPSAEAAEQRFIEAGPDEFIYARYGNPTVAMFEDRIASIEGAEAGFATASGMAAVNGALMSTLKAGDHVVAARALFGSCLYILEEILPRFGVDVTLIDGTSLEAWEAAIQQHTKLVFFETVSNPTLEVIDIEAVAKLAHTVGALVVVDNVFATPVFSRAIEQGADLVIYSTTKHIDGQGRALGGVILGRKEHIKSVIEPYMKHTGAAMSPFSAWLKLKGLETLDLRIRAQAENAQALAQALEGLPALQEVIYPGLPSHAQYALAKTMMGSGGTVLSLRLRGERDSAFKLLNNLSLARISNNLGDAKTIVTHPATTTHQRLSEEQRKELGISDGLIRVSLGIEDSKDIIEDFRTALAALG